jgi:hypothetical protein
VWHDSLVVSTQSCDRHDAGLAVGFAMMAAIMSNTILANVASDAFAVSSSWRSHLDGAANL